jgi:hypothetical protein
MKKTDLPQRTQRVQRQEKLVMSQWQGKPSGPAGQVRRLVWPSRRKYASLVSWCQSMFPVATRCTATIEPRPGMGHANSQWARVASCRSR